MLTRNPVTGEMEDDGQIDLDAINAVGLSGGSGIGPGPAPDQRLSMLQFRGQQGLPGGDLGAAAPLFQAKGPPAPPDVPPPTAGAGVQQTPGLTAAPPTAPDAPPVSNKPILDTKSTSQTTEKLSKVQQEDFAALDKIRADEQDAQKRLTADKVKDAAFTQQSSKDESALAAANQQARAQAIQEAQQRRMAAEATYQQKLDAFNKQDFHSFWSGRPAAAEVLTDIGVALGAFGASGRGQNEALQILNARVEQDFNLQKAQIEKAKDSVIMAKTGIADADQARAVAMQDLDIKQAAALEAIKARLAAGKAQQLGSTAAAQGDKDVAAIAKDIQERKERTTAGMATRTTSTQNFINPEAVELKAGARKTANAQNLEIYDPETGRPLGTARNARDVGAATKMLESAQKARTAVLALQAFHEANPGRQLGIAGVGTPEYAELQGLRKDVVNAFASLYGNGGSDIKMKGDAFRLPKEGDLFAGQEHTKQIGHLMETIDAVKSGVLRARGIEPPTDAAKPPVVNPASAPLAPASKLKLAQEAMNDPAAPAEVKAQAKKLLSAAWQASRR